jgi:hypothetical protein
MRYDFIAIPDSDVPRAGNQLFQHLLDTYASEQRCNPKLETRNWGLSNLRIQDLIENNSILNGTPSHHSLALETSFLQHAH